MNEPQQRIHLNAVKAWRITLFLIFLPLFLFPSIFLYIEEVIPQENWVIIALVSFLVVIIVLILLFTQFRWSRWKFEISEQEIELQRGILFKRRTLIPITRIQHVDTRQGPVYNLFKLSSVTVSTAANVHEIPALDDETADLVRRNISKFVILAKEDV